MLRRIAENPFIARILEQVSRGQSLLFEELWDAPKAALACLAQRATGKQLLIVSGGAREDRLFDDFAFFTGVSVLEFPAWETLPSEEIAPSPDIVGERFRALHEILHSEEPRILLCPLQSCLQRLPPPHVVRQSFLRLQRGDAVDFEALLERLAALGYQRCPVVADKGEFAVRGGLIDLFPVNTPDPYRLDFWGDELDTIRTFDPVGQRSIDQADSLFVTPATESLEGEVTSLLTYLGENTLVILDDLLALEDRAVSLEQISGAFSKSFVSFSTFLDEVQPFQTLYWTAQPAEQLGEVELLDPKGTRYYGKESAPHPIRLPYYHHMLTPLRCPTPFLRVSDALFDESEELLPALSRAAQRGMEVRFICETESEGRSYSDQLAGVSFCQGYLSSGFVLQEPALALVPLAELTGRYRVRRTKQRSSHHVLPSEHLELKSGDLVVHFHNGIGRYLGTEYRPNHLGIEVEHLSIEYAEQGKLFVPLSQSYLVSKYVGVKEETPLLHELGGRRWAKTRQSAERAVTAYAADLLILHAERKIASGTAFPPDGELLRQFESDFPYVETEDQLRAIQDVKADMVRPSVMDRLVCGDVGYGKTEVAMRAAIKAVVDGGKQVAVLVPTTLLAMQHLETFRARMGSYPVHIEMLSRLRTAKESREILTNLAGGRVDILIGTHRLISKDVQFKDLGLVIIDEEQRFGVRVKERLRAFKVGVDCLTLSATPIPRTLYLSLMGARDLSLINTPPQDRLPIKTVVCPFDEEKLRSALLRELARDGQAFVIHNRVETLYALAEHIRSLLPQARLLVGHGQMGEAALDHVFHTFRQGEADIVVATTIVENGVDIPNANTIVVDRADRFGLADLYQLRGRVGRWNRRAFAYFFTPRSGSLPDLSRQRLSALVEIGGHGGGMKIAMRDLEIRGAGNILGQEQSGHVSGVGFHLYCKLLKRAIDRLEGGAPALCETKVEFPQDARLPDSYVNDPSLRMEIYGRFGDATSEEEVDELLAEVHDRFGAPPPPVLWLHRLMRLRVVAARHQITALTLKGFTLTVERQKGKTKVRHQVLIAVSKSPAELEANVLAALKL